MATEQELKKGQYVVEPGIAISEFVEKLNKLSYQDFPGDAVSNLFQKKMISFEYLEPYVFFSDARYTRNLIHKSQDFELVLMCWKPGQHTAIHGYEGQKCWIRIELGILELTDYKEQPQGAKDLVKKISVKNCKQGFVDGPSYIHSVRNNTEHNAVSLHLYVKPVSQCKVYDLQEQQIKNIQLGYHSVHGKLIAPEEIR